MIKIRAILYMLKDMFFGNKNKEITTEHELVEKFKEADLAYGYYDENKDYEKMAVTIVTGKQIGRAHV